MKKNKIKWYSYMAFILSSPYLLESCASSVDNNNMIRNEANISCSELYPKKQNELTQINEFSDSSLGSESSTKEMKEASGEPNNLIENKEESSSEESDNVFQNSDPYDDLSKAVNYEDFRDFIENCQKYAKGNNERRYSSEDYYTDDDYYENDFSKGDSYKDFVLYLLQEKSLKDIICNLFEEDSLKEKFPKIFADINTERPKVTSGSSSPQKIENIEEETVEYKEEDLSQYESEDYLALAIKKIQNLNENELFLLRRESYSRLFDIIDSNDDKEKKALLEKLNSSTSLNCKINKLDLEYNSNIVYENENCGDVVEFKINKISFKIRYIEDVSICAITKLPNF